MDLHRVSASQGGAPIAANRSSTTTGRADDQNSASATSQNMTSPHAALSMTSSNMTSRTATSHSQMTRSASLQPTDVGVKKKRQAPMPPAALPAQPEVTTGETGSEEHQSPPKAAPRASMHPPSQTIQSEISSHRRSHTESAIPNVPLPVEHKSGTVEQFKDGSQPTPRPRHSVHPTVQDVSSVEPTAKHRTQHTETQPDAVAQSMVARTEERQLTSLSGGHKDPADAEVSSNSTDIDARKMALQRSRSEAGAGGGLPVAVKEGASRTGCRQSIGVESVGRQDNGGTVMGSDVVVPGNLGKAKRKAPIAPKQADDLKLPKIDPGTDVHLEPPTPAHGQEQWIPPKESGEPTTPCESPMHHAEKPGPSATAEDLVSTSSRSVKEKLTLNSSEGANNDESTRLTKSTLKESRITTGSTPDCIDNRAESEAPAQEKGDRQTVVGGESATKGGGREEAPKACIEAGEEIALEEVEVMFVCPEISHPETEELSDSVRGSAATCQSEVIEPCQSTASENSVEYPAKVSGVDIQVAAGGIPENTCNDTNIEPVVPGVQRSINVELTGEKEIDTVKGVALTHGGVSEDDLDSRTPTKGHPGEVPDPTNTNSEQDSRTDAGRHTNQNKLNESLLETADEKICNKGNQGSNIDDKDYNEGKRGAEDRLRQVSEHVNRGQNVVMTTETATIKQIEDSKNDEHRDNAATEQELHPTIRVDQPVKIVCEVRKTEETGMHHIKDVPLKALDHKNDNKHSQQTRDYEALATDAGKHDSVKHIENSNSVKANNSLFIREVAPVHRCPSAVEPTKHKPAPPVPVKSFKGPPKTVEATFHSKQFFWEALASEEDKANAEVRTKEDGKVWHEYKAKEESEINNENKAKDDGKARYESRAKEEVERNDGKGKVRYESKAKEEGAVRYEHLNRATGETKNEAKAKDEGKSKEESKTGEADKDTHAGIYQYLLKSLSSGAKKNPTSSHPEGKITPSHSPGGADSDSDSRSGPAPTSTTSSFESAVQVSRPGQTIDEGGSKSSDDDKATSNKETAVSSSIYRLLKKSFPQPYKSDKDLATDENLGTDKNSASDQDSEGDKKAKIGGSPVSDKNVATDRSPVIDKSPVTDENATIAKSPVTDKSWVKDTNPVTVQSAVIDETEVIDTRPATDRSSVTGERIVTVNQYSLQTRKTDDDNDKKEDSEEIKEEDRGKKEREEEETLMKLLPQPCKYIPYYGQATEERSSNETQSSLGAHMADEKHEDTEKRPQEEREKRVNMESLRRNFFQLPQPISETSPTHEARQSEENDGLFESQRNVEKIKEKERTGEDEQEEDEEEASPPPLPKLPPPSMLLFPSNDGTPFAGERPFAGDSTVKVQSLPDVSDDITKEESREQRTEVNNSKTLNSSTSSSDDQPVYRETIRQTQSTSTWKSHFTDIEESSGSPKSSLSAQINESQEEESNKHLNGTHKSKIPPALLPKPFKKPTSPNAETSPSLEHGEESTTPLFESVHSENLQHQESHIQREIATDSGDRDPVEIRKKILAASLHQSETKKYDWNADEENTEDRKTPECVKSLTSKDCIESVNNSQVISIKTQTPLEEMQEMEAQMKDTDSKIKEKQGGITDSICTRQEDKSIVYESKSLSESVQLESVKESKDRKAETHCDQTALTDKNSEREIKEQRKSQSHIVSVSEKNLGSKREIEDVESRHKSGMDGRQSARYSKNYGSAGDDEHEIKENTKEATVELEQPAEEHSMLCEGGLVESVDRHLSTKTDDNTANVRDKEVDDNSVKIQDTEISITSVELQDSKTDNSSENIPKLKFQGIKIDEPVKVESTEKGDDSVKIHNMEIASNSIKMQSTEIGDDSVQIQDLEHDDTEKNVGSFQSSLQLTRQSRISSKDEDEEKLVKTLEFVEDNSREKAKSEELETKSETHEEQTKRIGLKDEEQRGIKDEKTERKERECKGGNASSISIVSEKIERTDIKEQLNNEKWVEDSHVLERENVNVARDKRTDRQLANEENSFNSVERQNTDVVRGKEVERHLATQMKEAEIERMRQDELHEIEESNTNLEESNSAMIDDLNSNSQRSAFVRGIQSYDWEKDIWCEVSVDDENFTYELPQQQNKPESRKTSKAEYVSKNAKDQETKTEVDLEGATEIYKETKTGTDRKTQTKLERETKVDVDRKTETVFKTNENFYDSNGNVRDCFERENPTKSSKQFSTSPKQDSSEDEDNSSDSMSRRSSTSNNRNSPHSNEHRFSKETISVGGISLDSKKNKDDLLERSFPWVSGTTRVFPALAPKSNVELNQSDVANNSELSSKEQHQVKEKKVRQCEERDDSAKANKGRFLLKSAEGWRRETQFQDVRHTVDVPGTADADAYSFYFDLPEASDTKQHNNAVQMRNSTTFSSRPKSTHCEMQSFQDFDRQVVKTEAQTSPTKSKKRQKEEQFTQSKDFEEPAVVPYRDVNKNTHFEQTKKNLREWQEDFENVDVSKAKKKFLAASNREARGDRRFQGSTDDSVETGKYLRKENSEETEAGKYLRKGKFEETEPGKYLHIEKSEEIGEERYSTSEHSSISSHPLPRYEDTKIVSVETEKHLHEDNREEMPEDERHIRSERPRKSSHKVRPFEDSTNTDTGKYLRRDIYEDEEADYKRHARPEYSGISSHKVRRYEDTTNTKPGEYLRKENSEEDAVYERHVRPKHFEMSSRRNEDTSNVNVETGKYLRKASSEEILDDDRHNRPEQSRISSHKMRRSEDATAKPGKYLRKSNSDEDKAASDERHSVSSRSRISSSNNEEMKNSSVVVSFVPKQQSPSIVVYDKRQPITMNLELIPSDGKVKAKNTTRSHSGSTSEDLQYSCQSSPRLRPHPPSAAATSSGESRTTATRTEEERTGTRAQKAPVIRITSNFRIQSSYDFPSMPQIPRDQEEDAISASAVSWSERPSTRRSAYREQ